MSTVLPQKPGGMLTKNVTVRTGLASSSAVNDGKNFTYLHVILIYCVLIVAVVKEGVKTHRFCSVPTLCASISHPTWLEVQCGARMLAPEAQFPSAQRVRNHCCSRDLVMVLCRLFIWFAECM